MNDFNPLVIELQMEDYVERRLQDARRRSSEVSVTLVVLGHVAAAVRRVAAAVESWADGAAEPSSSAGLRGRAL
jgi:hypothetical protein